MTEKQNSKTFDLEERTYLYALNVRALVNNLSKTISNIEDSKQLVRASGSVAANYIEANESLSKKDFIYRIKICRKEAKESRLFLRLLDTNKKMDSQIEKEKLENEATELMKIFGAIITKAENK